MFLMLPSLIKRLNTEYNDIVSCWRAGPALILIKDRDQIISRTVFSYDVIFTHCSMRAYSRLSRSRAWFILHPTPAIGPVTTLAR
jgi:hypothetical protein